MFSRLTLVIFSAAISIATPHYHHGEDGTHPHWGEGAHAWGEGARSWGEGRSGGHKRGRGGGVMSVEKGVRCKAASSNSTLNSCAECEGGLKKEFDSTAHPHGIAANMVESAHEHLQANFIPEVSELMPPSDVMGDMLGLVKDDLEEGESKTVEFGGKITVEWGCNMTFSMEDGKRSRISQCGFKRESNMGKKKELEPEDDIDVELKEKNDIDIELKEKN